MRLVELWLHRLRGMSVSFPWCSGDLTVLVLLFENPISWCRQADNCKKHRGMILIPTVQYGILTR